MSQANLSELENDLYPSSSFVPRMAEVLKVSAMWLADGKKDRPGATLHQIATRHVGRVIYAQNWGMKHLNPNQYAAELDESHR